MWPVGQGGYEWGSGGLWDKGQGDEGYTDIIVGINDIIRECYWSNSINDNYPDAVFKHFTNKNSFHLFNNPLREVVAIISIIIPILEKKKPKHRKVK